jgi:CO/xanthine dehydrogenase Mo-binding subunit
MKWDKGIRTGLATIIGEELDVDPANMLVQAAGSHEDYNNPEFRVQGTGGSNAVRVFYRAAQARLAPTPEHYYSMRQL